MYRKDTSLGPQIQNGGQIYDREDVRHADCPNRGAYNNEAVKVKSERQVLEPVLRVTCIALDCCVVRAVPGINRNQSQGNVLVNGTA